MTVLQLFAPRFLDAAIGRVGIPLQRTDEPDGRGALYEPRVEDDRVEGRISFHTFRLSPYTWLQTHPRGKALGAVVAGVIGGALARRRFG